MPIATGPELLELLSSKPLSRAYGSLVRSLPEELPEAPGSHEVLLDCTEHLLEEAKLQTVMLSLLLEVASATVHKLGHAPTDAQRHRAAQLSVAHPRFFRKLTAAYSSGDATAAATAAARNLWASGASRPADVNPSSWPTPALCDPLVQARRRRLRGLSWSLRFTRSSSRGPATHQLTAQRVGHRRARARRRATRHCPSACRS